MATLSKQKIAQNLLQRMQTKIGECEGLAAYQSHLPL